MATTDVWNTHTRLKVERPFKGSCYTLFYDGPGLQIHCAGYAIISSLFHKEFAKNTLLKLKANLFSTLVQLRAKNNYWQAHLVHHNHA